MIGSIVAGFLLGFVLGTGYLEALIFFFFKSSSSSNAIVADSSTSTTSTSWFRSSPFANYEPNPWRQELARQTRMSLTFFRLRYTLTYQKKMKQWKGKVWTPFVFVEKGYPLPISNPSDPKVFAILREAVIREKGGYVHPDLGFLIPAPCGAARGIGMVRDSYHRCQIHCLPGLAEEKLALQRERQLAVERNETYTLPNATTPLFRQEEVLIRVPLSFQMTRSVAVDTLLPLLPQNLHAGFHQLDDAALLVLLLAHERGVGRYSPWTPYIASLPPEASCGYSIRLRPYMLDSIQALHKEYGVAVEGFKEELLEAMKYAHKIAEGLQRDYGAYLKTPDNIPMLDNISWALCQVASRATAGSAQHGSLRLVPVMDQINHDVNAGGFIELTGKERLENGDFVDAAVTEGEEEDDSGTFVIRSLRHGRRKALRKGQELLVNYNVPHYTALDWLVTLGFVPPEMQTPWQKMEPVLNRVRGDGVLDQHQPE